MMYGWWVLYPYDKDYWVVDDVHVDNDINNNTNNKNNNNIVGDDRSKEKTNNANTNETN